MLKKILNQLRYLQKKKLWKKKLRLIGLFIVPAFLINSFLFFAFPVINFYKNKAFDNQKKNSIKLVKTEIKAPKKAEPKRKKLQETKPKRNNQSKANNSRFKMTFQTSGSGAGLTSGKISGKIYKEGEVDRDAIPLKRVIPDYPPEAQSAGIGGEVEVFIIVDSTGKVVKAEIERGVNGYGLNEACIEAVLQWQFKPAVKDDVPVKMQFIIPFSF